MALKNLAPALAFALLASPLASSAAEPVQPCYVDAEISQGGRVSLNIMKYAKDAINATTFRLPVSCSKMQDLHVGEKVFDKFRWGSLVTEGSASSWNLKVKSIPQISNPDPTTCMTKLRLKESRFSLNPLAYAKDAINSQTFDWPMSCSATATIQQNTNLISDDFRLGSLLTKGSISNWQLKVVSRALAP